jgi:spoIIIJ-associated protein
VERESIDAHGRTTEEAIRSALEQLGVSRDEVDIEILTEGRPGVFGVGAQEARVRVTLIDDYEHDKEWDEPQPGALLPTDEDDEEWDEPQPDSLLPTGEHAETARAMLEHMLDLLDFPNVVTVRGQQQDRGKTTIQLDVAGDDVGLIIGRHGETLVSLQFLLNACLSKELPRDTRVVVDIEHYRDRREESLRGIALRAADRAIRERHPVTLQPMPPSERRIIHLTLQAHRYVSTESTGEGAERRVVVSPKQRTPPPRRPSYGPPRSSGGRSWG